MHTTVHQIQIMTPRTTPLVNNLTSLLFYTTLFITPISGESTDQLPFSSCDQPSTNSYPFCDTTLPTPQRAHDIVSRLTLDEKVLQLVNGAPAIPRLGIPAYEWWSEALHGVSKHGKGVRFNGTVTAATQFPQVILTAASFDSNLWYRIGQAIGVEARAMYNEGQAKGLTFWAPVVNVLRDPRWGRAQETPGEDPTAIGMYAVSYVRGIQGDSFEGRKLNDGQLQISACCKHFTANDLDEWNGYTRYDFDANVTKQDLADTYQPPFQSCIQQGQASGVMCAYNRVNGVPNCADYNLLTNTARGKWGFQGYITSDCDAVATIHDIQRYAEVPEDAVAEVLKAGMDVNCGSYLQKYTKSAVEQKKVSESEIDRALHNLFSIRIRLGLFNGNLKMHTFGNLTAKQICSKEHQDLALEAAQNGIVLLKNAFGLLPLSKSETNSLALVGPNVNATRTFLGNYEGFPCKNVTLLQALQVYVTNIKYHQGCIDSVNCTSVATDVAVEIAKDADCVVLAMGLDQTQEREKHDRVELVLPGKQEALVTSVAMAAKKPIILILLSGGPVDVSFARDNPKIGGILWAGYPGEAGGIALAEIIFGEHNPGGRLPMTWYPKELVTVPMTDMRMRPDPSTGYPGRTYRFYNGAKVFEYGHGLSYSSYSYEFVKVTTTKIKLNQLMTRAVNNSTPIHRMLVSEIGSELCKKAEFSAVVEVKNEGKMAGNHAVLLFARPNKVRKGNPIKQLLGFQRVSLGAEERGEAEFIVKPCEQLSKANKYGSMMIEEGSYYLVVGEKEYPIDIVF